MKRGFKTRLLAAVSLGWICAVLLVILALCGGSSASVKEVEENSARTAEAFVLRYGNASAGSEVDLMSANADGRADSVTAFSLTAKRDAVSVSLTVCTDRLFAVAALTVTVERAAQGAEENAWEVMAEAGGTGFFMELPIALSAGDRLQAVFSQEVPVQAIFLNFQ